MKPKETASNDKDILASFGGKVKPVGKIITHSLHFGWFGGQTYYM